MSSKNTNAPDSLLPEPVKHGAIMQLVAYGDNTAKIVQDPVPVKQGGIMQLIAYGCMDAEPYCNENCSECHGIIRKNREK